MEGIDGGGVNEIQVGRMKWVGVYRVELGTDNNLVWQVEYSDEALLRKNKTKQQALLMI